MLKGKVGATSSLRCYCGESCVRARGDHLRIYGMQGHVIGITKDLYLQREKK